jgi:hypothetical protein
VIQVYVHVEGRPTSFAFYVPAQHQMPRVGETVDGPEGIFTITEVGWTITKGQLDPQVTMVAVPA